MLIPRGAGKSILNTLFAPTEENIKGTSGINFIWFDDLSSAITPTVESPDSFGRLVAALAQLNKLSPKQKKNVRDLQRRLGIARAQKNKVVIRSLEKELEPYL